MNTQPSTSYPGEEEAKRLGYTLHSFTGQRTKANYVKGGVNLPATLHLSVSGQGEAQLAKLEAFIGIVRLSIDGFSFPNVNFPLFEKQIINILQKTAEKETQPHVPK